EYLAEPIGEGTEKTVYLTTDRKSVVALYKDAREASDPERQGRLEAIIHKYNPTLDSKEGAYWASLYCWPTAIVKKPTLGLVAPCYPRNFFFPPGPGYWSEREKQGKWFSSPRARQHLPKSERGNWLGYLQIVILLARAVARMHRAGLAHSDL